MAKVPDQPSPASRNCQKPPKTADFRHHPVVSFYLKSARKPDSVLDLAENTAIFKFVSVSQMFSPRTEIWHLHCKISVPESNLK
jgi:hypothetical protein